MTGSAAQRMTSAVAKATTAIPYRRQGVAGRSRPARATNQLRGLPEEGTMLLISSATSRLRPTTDAEYCDAEFDVG